MLCSEAFKKLKKLAYLGDRYYGITQNSRIPHVQVFRLTSVQIKLMDPLLCQDYDYLMNDCSSG